MTIIRRIRAEIADIPATTALGTAWVIVFLLMLFNYLQTSPSPSIRQIIYGNFISGHRYGDLTPNELFRGEIWRPLTCTFVHYNLLHISLNLYGLYQLGGLVETWYGSGTFLAIYAVIGGVGNILSTQIRRELGSNLAMHSGGGSTVVLGLVALAAVVGWRMRTRIGDYLSRQMISFLILTAVLGALLPIIDNWGHAGGAFVGACVGIFNNQLIQLAKLSVARLLGALACLLMVSSALAQVRDNRKEEQIQARLADAFVQVGQTDEVCRKLAKVEWFYRSVLQAQSQAAAQSGVSPLRPAPWRYESKEPWPHLSINEQDFSSELPKYVAMLDSVEKSVGTTTTAADFRRVRQLLAQVVELPATIANWREFRSRWAVLLRRAVEDQLKARLALETLARNQKSS